MPNGPVHAGVSYRRYRVHFRLSGYLAGGLIRQRATALLLHYSKLSLAQMQNADLVL